MSELIPFYIPPSRVVAGSPTFKQDKDTKGKLKEKPNWFIALAVPKSDPQGVAAINVIIQTALAGYANHQPTLRRIHASLVNGGFNPDIPGAFRWKIEDGDGEKRSREGYAGCWIFKLSTIYVSIIFSNDIACCGHPNHAGLFQPPSIPIRKHR